MSTEPLIIIDSREQQPYCFRHAEVRALVTGDYSLAGFENEVTVERKTKADAYASLGQRRDRFERELERMTTYRYGAIVIEATLADLLHRPSFSQLHPKAAVNTLLAWSVKFGVHVFFAGDRQHGNALTQRLLEKFWKYHHERGARS